MYSKECKQSQVRRYLECIFVHLGFVSNKRMMPLKVLKNIVQLDFRGSSQNENEGKIQLSMKLQSPIEYLEECGRRHKVAGLFIF